MRRTDSLEKTWCWERLRAEEKGVTEDEMVGWHHRLSEHESEQTPWDSGGQESLLCCSPWDHKELDMTEQLNNNVPWEKAHIQLPCHVEDTTTLSILLGCQSTSPGLRAYTAQEMSCTKVYLQCPGGDTSNSTIFFFKNQILTELFIHAENLLQKRKTWPTFKDLMLERGYHPHSQFVLI